MDKNKLKDVLLSLSSDKEKDKLLELDLQKKSDEKLKQLESNFSALLDSFTKYTAATNKYSSNITELFSDFSESLTKKLGALAGTITTSYEKNKPVNAPGVYKDMINQLSAIDESIKKKPVPVWNWPQYASVGVRNKDFSNVDPSVAYPNATTTPAIPYGTLPVFDNAGTIAKVSSTVGLPVNLVAGSPQNSTISTNNSTTTTLAGGASFTGTADDCTGYNSVTVLLTASHDSSSGGMKFQYSSDGTNWDLTNAFTMTVSESSTRRFQFPVMGRYFRVNYTNGGTTQTSFRVQTILHKSAVLTTIHRVDDIIATDRSAELVKAVSVAKVEEGSVLSTASEGQYDNMSMSTWRELRTRDQRSLDLANCNDSTAFTTLGNDTANLANSTNHVFGTGAVTFDKVNGSANTVFAGIHDTITSINIQERFESGGFVGLGCYLPSLSNVVAVFIRIGTDSSNYNEWEWGVSEMTAGQWMALRRPTNQPSSYAGNGWTTSAITYVAFGVEFSAESNTLSGIIFDNVHMVGGRVTDTTIDANVTSSVNTPNINLHRMGGTPTDTNAGNKSAGTMRVTLATDDTNAAAMNTSLAILDDWDESDRAKVNPIAGQAGVAGGSGTVSALTQRVVLATDVALPAGTNIIGRTGHDITGIGDGRTTVTTAGTRVVLASSTSCKKVDIAALVGNTGIVVVGGSTVVASAGTRQGIPLYAGDIYSLEIDNLNDVYLDSTVNGEGVSYTYYT